jgi:hypothetical protein
MGTMMKIVERLDQEAGFEFQKADIRDLDGLPILVGVFGGVECDVETKETLLDAGVVSCNPIEFTPDWPLAIVLEDEDGQRHHLDEASVDPRAVAAARRFHELLLNGEAKPGMEL